MQEHLWVIYGVRLKTDDEYRYIGLTRQGASVRFASHIKYSYKLTELTPFMCWSRKHGQHAITIDVIEECEVGNEALLNFREQFWIATMRQQFAYGVKKKQLLNLTDGGDSMIHIFTDEWRSERSRQYAGSGNPAYGKHYPKTDEQRRAMAERMTGAGNHQYGKTGELAASYGRTGEKHPMFGKHHTEEAKASMREKMTGVPKSPEHRAKLTEANRKRAKTPEAREHSQRAMHNRWHVNRDIVNPDCKFCQ